MFQHPGTSALYERELTQIAMTLDSEFKDRRRSTRPFKEQVTLALARAEQALRNVRADEELHHISDAASIAILKEAVERYRIMLDSDRK